jgi:hypothetical protein
MLLAYPPSRAFPIDITVLTFIKHVIISSFPVRTTTLNVCLLQRGGKPLAHSSDRPDLVLLQFDVVTQIATLVGPLTKGTQ